MASQRHRPHIVVIQIDESDAQILQLIGETRGAEQVFHVAPMAGTFGDDHLARAGPEKCGRGAGDDERIRVDQRARFVLDQVRLEEHRTSADVERQFSKAARDDVRQIDRVVGRVENGHRRSRRSREIAAADTAVVRRHAVSAATTGSALSRSRREMPRSSASLRLALTM